MALSCKALLPVINTKESTGQYMTCEVEYLHGSSHVHGRGRRLQHAQGAARQRPMVQGVDYPFREPWEMPSHGPKPCRQVAAPASSSEQENAPQSHNGINSMPTLLVCNQHL